MSSSDDDSANLEEAEEALLDRSSSSDSDDDDDDASGAPLFSSSAPPPPPPLRERRGDATTLRSPLDYSPTTTLSSGGSRGGDGGSVGSRGYNLETDVDDTYSTHDLKIVFALWNAMVGAGSVLVFPWAMSQSGVLLGAIISPTFGFICCVFSASRLVEHSVNANSRERKGNWVGNSRGRVRSAPTDYSDVVGEWFGKKWKRWARIGIVLLMVQSVVVYDMILSDVMFGLVSGGYSDWRERYDKAGERNKKSLRGGGGRDDDDGTNSSSGNSSDGGVNGTMAVSKDPLFRMYDDISDGSGNGTIYATSPPLAPGAPPPPFAPSNSSNNNNNDDDDDDDDHHENNDLHVNCQKTITWRSSLNGDCFTPKTASVMVALLLFVMSTRTSADVFVKLSAFGPAFTTYLVAFVLLQSLVVEKVVAPRHFFPGRGGKAFGGVATLLGACSSAFFVHHAIVPVLKTNKKSKNNMRNLVLAYILAVGTYTCVGIVGNFSSTYVASEAKREKIGLGGPSENFLNAFPTEPNKALFAFTAHVAAALQMFTICPLLLFILRTSVYGLFFGRRAESKTTLGGIAVINAVCLLIGTLCAADKDIDVGGVVSVCGAIFGFVYVFLFPSMIRLEATKAEATGREIVHPPHHRYPLRSRHAVIQEEGDDDDSSEEKREEEEEDEEETTRLERRAPARRGGAVADSAPFWSVHSYQTLFFHGAFVAFGFSILITNVF
jgi:hypothetical protein